MLLDRLEERESSASCSWPRGAGRSGTLVLRGEPGIGKSVLIEEAIAAASDFLVSRVVGIEAKMTLGYAGFHQLLWRGR